MEQKIRRVELSDAAAIREIYAPFISDQATSFELTVPDVAEIRRRIAEQRERYPWLVFERGVEVLGYAYASSHRARLAYQWCVEVSVYVHPKAHRAGVGRALYRSLLALLREQGYVNAYAGITLPNAASVALHESLGFVAVGTYPRIGFKFDCWHDVMWLHQRLRDDPRPLPEPRPTRDLWQNAAMMAMLDAEAETIRIDRQGWDSRADLKVRPYENS